MKKILILILISSVLLPQWGKSQAFVQSKTNDFDWRVIGRALFDGGVFFSDSTQLGNGMTIADVRIGVQIHFLKNWEGKIELGYANSKVSMKDIYIAYANGNHLFKAGHFFEPLGIDTRSGTLNFRLMNMSVTNAILGDKRKIGVSYAYNRHYFATSAGFFSDGDIDNTKSLNEGYTLAAKFVGRPVYDEEKLLHLGFGVRYSEHDRDESRKVVYKAGAPTYVLNKEENVFLRAEIPDMINQWRFGGDIIALYKGFYMQSECLATYVNRIGNENYMAKGCYVQLGYLVLGNKQYKYNSTQGWVNNPDPKNLELLVRYNVTNMNDCSSDIMGGKVQDITLGANYFINKYVVVKLNYTHMMTDAYAVNGKESFDFIQGRIQFSF